MSGETCSRQEGVPAIQPDGKSRIAILALGIARRPRKWKPMRWPDHTPTLIIIIKPYILIGLVFAATDENGASSALLQLRSAILACPKRKYYTCQCPSLGFGGGPASWHMDHACHATWIMPHHDPDKSHLGHIKQTG
ncbi:uncharacterized protein MYCFIDRAFT_173601 [Pseudocercospora fijiensis CIRAD86]|uniref:Uncharacterized protein n=1 Tax=Pseudocercospora fijiensis (strain CIRAD86) TaxID=383855 RepID=M3B5L5_PSEFD|nr:uncharacterized protein MYCFIDRAFT_173601 [Pseudocercospora fijiensis CIRAD86]EME84652.1 hypothetical protein MYCFIDRAFT_173601 [Pseudocercospora fijiensis CIRAD86]